MNGSPCRASILTPIAVVPALECPVAETDFISWLLCFVIQSLFHCRCSQLNVNMLFKTSCFPSISIDPAICLFSQTSLFVIFQTFSFQALDQATMPFTIAHKFIYIYISAHFSSTQSWWLIAPNIKTLPTVRISPHHYLSQPSYKESLVFYLLCYLVIKALPLSHRCELWEIC